VKLAVLILVLANFALFAWLRWAGSSTPETDLAAIAQAGKSSLALLPPAAPASVASVNPARAMIPSSPTISSALAHSTAAASAAIQPAPTEASVTTVCLLWGPMAGASVESTLAARLDSAGYAARVIQRSGQAPGAYRVVLPGFASSAMAQKAADELRLGGVTDQYLQPATATQGPSLALGLFRNRGDAEKRAAKVRALGFQPVIHASLRGRTRRYVNVPLPAGASAGAAIAAAATSRSPRRVSCTPAPKVSTTLVAGSEH
jgi:hypothetical protein